MTVCGIAQTEFAMPVIPRRPERAVAGQGQGVMASRRNSGDGCAGKVAADLGEAIAVVRIAQAKLSHVVVTSRPERAIAGQRNGVKTPPCNGNDRPAGE